MAGRSRGPCVHRHGKNVNSDVWRQMQLWRGASNPDHPFSAFHTGNAETLMTRPTVRPCACWFFNLIIFFQNEETNAILCCDITQLVGLDE